MPLNFGEWDFFLLKVNQNPICIINVILHPINNLYLSTYESNRDPKPLVQCNGKYDFCYKFLLLRVVYNLLLSALQAHLVFKPMDWKWNGFDSHSILPCAVGSDFQSNLQLNLIGLDFTDLWLPPYCLPPQSSLVRNGQFQHSTASL